MSFPFLMQTFLGTEVVTAPITNHRCNFLTLWILALSGWLNVRVGRIGTLTTVTFLGIRATLDCSVTNAIITYSESFPSFLIFSRLLSRVTSLLESLDASLNITETYKSTEILVETILRAHWISLKLMKLKSGVWWDDETVPNFSQIPAISLLSIVFEGDLWMHTESLDIFIILVDTSLQSTTET